MMEDTSLTAKVKDMSWHWRAFSNVGNLGCYEYLSQTVQANSLERRHVEEMFERKDLDLLGRELLVNTYNALTARATDNLAEFWRIPETVTDLRRVHFPKYFSTDHEAARQPWDGRPWKWAFSCGREFGVDGRLRTDRPILFTRFATQDDVDVCRVPFSVASLTEVNAMAEEMEVDLASLAVLPEDAALIEERLYSDRFLRQLYDPQTVVYTTAAHCVANTSGIQDAAAAYSAASALATLCLNLPSQAFEDFRVHESFSAWGDAPEQLRAIRDRGFAFLTIARHGQGFNGDPYEWVDAAAQAAGLQPIEELSALALGEIRKSGETLMPGPFSSRAQALLRGARE